MTPTDHCGENSEFGKTLFATMREQTLLGNNYQWILNLEEKFEKQNICIISNCLPTECLLVARGKIVTVQWKKNRQNFDLVIKINITNEWQMDTVSSDMTP